MRSTARSAQADADAAAGGGRPLAASVAAAAAAAAPAAPAGASDGKAATVPTTCNACSHCGDVCRLPDCVPCRRKRARAAARAEEQANCCAADGSTAVPGTFGLRRKWPEMSICEVARHDTHDDCWLFAGPAVYDVTTFLHSHPGGLGSILRKAGGKQDAAVDIPFHSAAGQRRWKEHRVGTLVPCVGRAGPEFYVKPESKSSCAVS